MGNSYRCMKHSNIIVRNQKQKLKEIADQTVGVSLCDKRLKIN